MPELDRFYRDNQSRVGLVVIAVNDQESDMRALLAGGGYQLPVVMDPSSLVGGQYGLRAVPTLVIVDPLGKITKVHLGGMSSADLSALVDGTVS